MTEINRLQELILNVRQPHVIRQMQIPWKCFEMPFSKWCMLYHEHLETSGKTVKFEIAPRKFGNFPQWERFRRNKTFNFKEFYERAISESDDLLKDNWIGFNYKNIEGLPNPCRTNISFSHFGFSGVNDDITYWLGSEGAHTPCHYDTYGCNVVVQVYGSKMWLLFPPETKLSSIRIPYEESSVYCSEVFYSPKDISGYESISKDCYRCVLNPGDVLIVPNKWWHYVENLSPAFSVNSWIPLDKDTDSRVEECIVKYLIESVLNFGPDGLKDEFLNPNEDLIGEETLLKIFHKLATERLISEKGIPTIKKENKIYPYQYKLMTEDIIQSIDENIQKVENISEDEFYKILKNNSKRFSSRVDKPVDSIKSLLVNSVCNPKVIKEIKQIYLEKLSKSDLPSQG